LGDGTSFKQREAGTSNYCFELEEARKYFDWDPVLLEEEKIRKIEAL